MALPEKPSHPWRVPTGQRAGGRAGTLFRRSVAVLALGALAAFVVVELIPTPAADARRLVPAPQPRRAVPLRPSGYTLVTDAGVVHPFGASGTVAPPADFPSPVVAIARTANGTGTWTATANGGVFTAGDAPFYGSLGGTALRRPVVDIAPTPGGTGYWLIAADGGVFAFGDATFYGTTARRPLSAPIVDLAATRTGRGYWLIAADGGVFAFGDARFNGSLAGTTLRRPVVAMAPTPTNRGYWMASADGGVFAFGDAPYLGRPAADQVGASVVDIAVSPTGEGYWLASVDGGVFAFGDAPFHGSPVGATDGPIVALAAGAGPPSIPTTPAGRRPAVPSTPSEPATAAPLSPVPPAVLGNRYGHDISWPQCDGPYPGPSSGYGIVGVTGGRPFTQNRCLASEWTWATAGPSGGGVYVNLAAPAYGDPTAMHGPAGNCAPDELPCQTYNHSANNVLGALAYARSVGADPPMWWLDVEVGNRWTGNHSLNTLTVRAAAETLEHEGRRVGIYSTPVMWRRITGGAQLPLPGWVAGAPTDAEAPSWCDRPDRDFTGHGIWLVQSIPLQFDVNYACSPVLTDPDQVFAFRD